MSLLRTRQQGGSGARVAITRLVWKCGTRIYIGMFAVKLIHLEPPCLLRAYPHQTTKKTCAHLTIFVSN
ncbi:hypothetical protein E2C01_042238 [Portunus trituberculatus]|uniref:Uncharacterized protein n=1 Tax=Portunus trituberculatus TaxID=210409 RepID=A0A5B7FT37_PORTR|nr:hypothetical protein [Portunus trituberculatus]